MNSAEKGDGREPQMTSVFMENWKCVSFWSTKFRCRLSFDSKELTSSITEGIVAASLIRFNLLNTLFPTKQCFGGLEQVCNLIWFLWEFLWNLWFFRSNYQRRWQWRISLHLTYRSNSDCGYVADIVSLFNIHHLIGLKTFNSRPFPGEKPSCFGWCSTSVLLLVRRLKTL